MSTRPRARWRPRRIVRGTSLILSWCMIQTLAVGPVLGQQTAGEQASTPRIYSMEAGAGIGSYPEETAHSVFASLAVSRPFKDTWRFSASHDKRFGDAGIGIGAGYTYYWNSGYSLSAGLSTGTGEVIHPRYAIGITGGKDVLPGLLASLSYLRWQSRDRSRFDAFMIGATWYAADHWIIGGGGRAQLGQPGSEWSLSADFGLTYVVYLNTYVSAGFTISDVSYQLATSPPGTAVVEYSDSSYRLSVTKYINPTMGLSGLLEYSPFWDSTWLTLRFFKSL